MKHRVVRGEVAYRRYDGSPRGREWFRFDIYPGAGRTMSTVSEIHDSQILRHVVYTVDEDWRPQDASVRLSIAGAFVGSGWFRFAEDLAECESWTAAAGRISQRVDLDVWTPGFGPHPVVADCWLLAAFDLTGPSIQTVRGIRTSSPEPNGGTGPMLHVIDLSVEYVGEEEVEVPAGAFPTRHFRFLLGDDLPPEDLWITADHTLVRITWDVFQTSYELDRITEIGA